MCRQEVELKKQALDKIDMLDADNKEEMKVLNESINPLISAVSDALNILHQLIEQQRAPLNIYAAQPNNYIQYPIPKIPRESQMLDNRNNYFIQSSSFKLSSKK